MVNLEKFKILGLSETALKALEQKGFEEPTEIQSAVIPLLLSGTKDIVGQAKTGTGKTAAFGLPILELITGGSRHVQVLILVPTRELAIQVSEEINSLKGSKKVFIAPIYGGASFSEQVRKLKMGLDIVVGTPGRVLDHIRRGTLLIDRVSYFVLDEADEMLNMGFIEDVETIISSAGEDRRVLLFSATMPREILDIAKRYMKQYELIKVSKEQLTVDLTEQIYFEVEDRDKFEALCRIIDVKEDFYGLIFCRTKIDVDDISRKLIDRGYNAEGLHGDISQNMRERILDKFKAKRTTILVATDVASRGIDVVDLTHVINFSLPQDPESYVHRIGRTGRAGKEGTAITFVTPYEYRKLTLIKRFAKTDIQRQKLPKIDDIIAAKKERIKSMLENIISNDDLFHFNAVVEEICADFDPKACIAALLKHSFGAELNPENYRAINEKKEQSGNPDGAGRTRLFVALGTSDGMNVKKLLALLVQRSGLEERTFKDVKIFETFSFVAVPYEDVDLLMRVFKGTNGERTLIARAHEKGESPKNSGRKPDYKAEKKPAAFAKKPHNKYQKKG